MRLATLALSGKHIVFDAYDKEFGITPGLRLQYVSFLATNVSNKPVKVLASHSGCGCAFATEIPTTVEPASSKPIIIAVDATTLKGDFDKTLSLYTSDSEDSIIHLRIRNKALQQSPGR